MPPWRRRGRSTDPGEHEARITEAANNAPAPIVVPPSRGYPSDIPLGGTTRQNAGYQGQVDRRGFLDELYGAYLACPWAAACVDVIARTVTAGGVEISPDTGEDENEPKPGTEVLAAQALLDFVNPREDIRQLARGSIADEGVFGDAFLEVVWFAGRPVAIYSLDAPSMIPLADEHGTIYGYVQNLDPNRTADFEPHEVIQISLDSPRGGLYGVGPTQKNLIPITAWLFTAGLLKETMRKGNPKDMHVDYPLEVSQPEIDRDIARYMVQNIGIANIGRPFVTRGKAQTKELSVNQIAEYLKTLDQQRDVIVSGYGVPPSKVGIIETGNIGGGTGTEQDRTFRVNTCGPMGEAWLEKVTYHLLRQGFGVDDAWRARFGDVDWRDDKVVEEIRDMRIRNGTWTINQGRAQIGEPAVDGGDEAVLIDRQNLVLVRDLVRYSDAAITAMATKGASDAQASQNQKAHESITETAGVMVAIFPPADIAASLVVEDGLDVSDLHLTLAYLDGDLDADALQAVVRAWALTTPPLDMTVSGVGLFTPTDDGLPVTYASVDAPGLPTARQRLVTMLAAAGLPVSVAHGFTPHVTLAYADVVATAPRVTASFTAEHVVACLADSRTPYPLTGAPATETELAAAASWVSEYETRRAQVLAELP